MNTRIPLGRQARIPPLGLGTWQMNQDTARIVCEAISLGYRLIDTSGDYGTQPGVGDGIRLSGIPREEIFVITKVEENEDTYDAVGRNLRELRLDYADLVLLHRPPPSGAGEELWAGLIRARDADLCTEIGVSSYSTALMDELIDASGVVPAANQVEWTPFGWSPQLLEHGRSRGIQIQAYCPLSRTTRLGDEQLRGIADRHYRSPAQVLLRWDIQLGVVPLPKAARREHLAENLGALDFELSAEEMNELGRLNERYSALGVLPYA